MEKKYDIKEVRLLITKGHVKRAVNLMEGIITGSHKNDFALLASNFNHWEKQNSLGLGPSKEERNRIVYALLNLLSTIEAQKSGRIPKFHKQIMGKYERDLSEAHKLLTEIKEEKQAITSLVEKIHLLADSKRFDKKSFDKNVTYAELEKIVEIQIGKYERLYNTLRLNTFFMLLIVILSPFLTNGDNLFEDAINSNSNISDEDDDNNGAEADID